MSAEWKSKIEETVASHKVVVFMRGTPDTPRCGFSARVVRVLNELNVPFATQDMDSDPELWKTLSELNNWPTSPQIFINGEFVGGCDIVMEMHKNGELAAALG